MLLLFQSIKNEVNWVQEYGLYVSIVVCLANLIYFILNRRIIVSSMYDNNDSLLRDRLRNIRNDLRKTDETFLNVLKKEENSRTNEENFLISYYNTLFESYYEEMLKSMEDGCDKFYSKRLKKTKFISDYQTEVIEMFEIQTVKAQLSRNPDEYKNLHKFFLDCKDRIVPKNKKKKVYYIFCSIVVLLFLIYLFLKFCL